MFLFFVFFGSPPSWCSAAATTDYCLADMYEGPHAGMGGYAAMGGGEHCMYGGEGPGYNPCERLHQRLHHPPCMEQAWPPSQHYSCSYAAPPVYKSECCSMEIPLSHFHPQPEYFPEIKPEFSYLPWIQDGHKRGTSSGSPELLDGGG